MDELPKQTLREQSKQELTLLLRSILHEGDTLTKGHLANLLFELYGFPKKFCREIVEMFFEEGLEALARGDELKLSNFGVFSIKSKSERPGRNPKSGEPAVIKARKVVTFHPSGQLRDEVVEGLKEKAAEMQRIAENS